MRTQIYIYPDVENDCWMAEIIDEGREPMILPTPFTGLATAAEVCAALEARNPGAIVDWFESKAEWLAGAV